MELVSLNSTLFMENKCHKIDIFKLLVLLLQFHLLNELALNCMVYIFTLNIKAIQLSVQVGKCVKRKSKHTSLEVDGLDICRGDMWTHVLVSVPLFHVSFGQIVFKPSLPQ